MTDPKHLIECWICGKLFEPDPEKVKAWAESERDFDGTDWECPTCQERALAMLDDDDDDEPDWSEPNY